ncbi:MAG: hypothetical protein PVJ33_16880 [Lysobacterales bacterium]|jgi:hypothetical protein
MRKRLNGYPRGFYAGLVLTLLALLASGVCLLPSMLSMRLDLDIAWQIGGGVRLAGAAVHCLAGFVTAALVGSLAMVHMRSGLRQRRNHLSGLALLTLVIVMVLSAVGIYYAGNQTLSRGSSVAHLTAATLACALFAWHVLKGAQLRTVRDATAGRQGKSRTLVRGKVFTGSTPVAANIRQSDQTG